MIQTEKEYESTKLALEHAEKALVALRQKLYKESPERYYILSESYLKHISYLRSELDEYVGIREAEEKTMPAVIVLTYFFAAPPLLMVIYALLTGSPYVVAMGTSYSDMIYFVFNLIFALAALIPVIWFIVWAYRIESGYNTYRM